MLLYGFKNNSLLKYWKHSPLFCLQASRLAVLFARSTDPLRVSDQLPLAFRLTASLSLPSDPCTALISPLKFIFLTIVLTTCKGLINIC